MAAPTGYTEKTLAEYMHAALGKVAEVMAYAVGAGDAGSYAEAVNETLLRYGVTSITLATDLAKLRALALVQAWRKACNDLVTAYHFTAENAGYDRGQMFTQAEANLQRALIDSLPHDANYVIVLTREKPLNDPYRYLPDDLITP